MEEIVTTNTCVTSNLTSITSKNNSEYIVIFHSDGCVEINPKYTVTEAARKFWDVVKELAKGDSNGSTEILSSSNDRAIND